MSYRYVVLCLSLGCGAIAQTMVDLRTQSKSVDFTAASSTKPFKAGASLPAACGVGELFFKTNAAAGQNLYACTVLNSWTLQAGGTTLYGDANGPVGSNVVTQIQGRPVSGTAPAGGQSLVWNASTSRWEVQNVTGAIGPTGPTGPIGLTGAAGAPGAVGPTGSAGPQGPAGVQGAIGPIGAQGPKGATGSTGATGTPGATGAQGATGPAGPQGATGPTGVQGLVGAIGPAGAQGPAGVAGPTGAQGLAGASGATGPMGATGPTGLQGSAGVQGPSGPTGAQGSIGPAGAQGVAGPQGPAGPIGPTGAAGLNGAIARVQNSGSNLPIEPVLNFTSGGCSDDSANGRTNCNGAGISGVTVSVDGVAQGTQSTLNLVAGYGITQACANNTGANRVDCAPSLNTAVAATNARVESSACQSLVLTSVGVPAYTATLATNCQALTNYTIGQFFLLTPDATCSGSCSLKIDNLGTVSIRKIDGVTDPGGSLVANQPQMVAYNGTAFLLLGAPAYAGVRQISFTIDGNGSPIASGTWKDFPSVNFACTINKVTIAADRSGSITVDIWKSNGAIPTSANKISASAPVTLSSAQLNQNSALTGWTTSITPGDVFGFNVASASTVTRAVGQLWCQ
jgi:collagen triple helix repeat protein